MTDKQSRVLEQLAVYLVKENLEIVEERTIDYGRQLRITDGTEICPINIYNSGKVVVGGTKSTLKEHLVEWKNLQQARMQSSASSRGNPEAQSRTTKFVVALAKVRQVRDWIAALPVEITWYEGDSDEPRFYQAELRSGNERVVLTQYRTGTLTVQGKAHALFDQVCDRLDGKLSQAMAERAARYIPEENREEAMEVMKQPRSEDVALKWIVEHVGEEPFGFLYPHDQETLLSAAALLDAVEQLGLDLPDYSVLVMPFARAYEGFLLKLFCQIGMADEEEIERDVREIQIGKWIGELKDKIVDGYRHGHLVSDLDTAWSGCRHLLMHSDPARNLQVDTLSKAKREIGTLSRALDRGFAGLVQESVALTVKEDETRSQTAGSPKGQAVRIENVDESLLLQRLKRAKYPVESIDDPSKNEKWRVIEAGWQVFCPRKPGDLVIVRGEDKQSFIKWYHQEEKADAAEGLADVAVQAHIGVDEAGKGDYFGPLVVAAVYVASEAAMDLIRIGVKDSKSLSDSTIAGLALEIRERCLNEVIVLMPSEYNETYEEKQNLNILLADLHAEAIESLVEETGCREVVDDQFAAAHVLESAVASRDLDIELEQRTNGEQDVAVAAASILARAAFVAAIEDFRAKSGLDIPLGSSSPRVVEVGRTIVRRWGAEALGRIAKTSFKTTKKILSG